MRHKTKRHATGAACVLGMLLGLLLLPQAHTVRADHTARLTLQAVQDHVDDLGDALDALVDTPPVSVVETALPGLWVEDVPIFAQCPSDMQLIAAYIGTPQYTVDESCYMVAHTSLTDINHAIQVVAQTALNRALCINRTVEPTPTPEGVTPSRYCACIAICGP